jgi:hypothetical protein
MADKLVRWLNDRGYQPVFIPVAGVHPPELYVFIKPRLVRLGTLKSYLPSGKTLPAVASNRLADIQIAQTSAKSVRGTAKFLGNALRGIGITQAPGLDLSFAGTGDFVFDLADVTYEETAPAAIMELLKDLRTELIPRNYMQDGRLHVAYHYAYASKLEIRKADGGKFEGNVSATEIDNFIKLGSAASVKVENGDALVFTPRKSERVAFAYKAGELRRAGRRLEFFPEEVARFAGVAGAEGEAPAYLPSRGQVLAVEDSPAEGSEG